MKRVRIERILEDDKSMLLEYDQGLELGPLDFNINTIDPNYIINVAAKGRFHALILQKGIAEHYYENYKRQVQLIIKLNGKTNIAQIEPVASQVCSVRKAIDLGAAAVGYTIYVGSAWENKMLEEFGKIQEEAHDYGIPTIAWMYPRGKFVSNAKSTSNIAYAARVGLELGADFVKIHYNKILEEFKWIVRAAANCKVLVAAGQKLGERELLHNVDDVMKAGCSGIVMGSELWQHKSPLKLAQAVRSVMFEGNTVDEALRFLE